MIKRCTFARTEEKPNAYLYVMANFTDACLMSAASNFDKSVLKLIIEMLRKISHLHAIKGKQNNNRKCLV